MLNILFKFNNYLYRVKLLIIIIYIRFNYIFRISFKSSIDSFLDLLVKKIYNKVYRIKSYILFSLTFFVYAATVQDKAIFFLSENILFLEFYYFFILTGIFITLIIITQKWIENIHKREYSLFNYIVKYVLITLLFFTILAHVLILIVLVISVLKFILSCITLKYNLINKLNDLKLSLDYRLSKLNNNKPKKPEFNFYSYYKERKKSKNKALALKEKLLQIKDHQPIINSPSLAEKRNWKGKIIIEKTSTYSSSDQLKNLKYEFEAYNNQEKKFKKIVVDINKGRENFYANESKDLFNSYVGVVKILKRNLKEIEKNLKK